MLMGTTYAWFTDSVTSAGNKIVAGTLDIDLYLYDANAADYKEITNESSPIFGEGGLAQADSSATLWEPGKTQVAYLKLVNNGTLDLKYQVALDVKDVAKKLNEVVSYVITPDAEPVNAPVKSWNGKGTYVGTGIVPVATAQDITLGAGATHYFALSIHMDEEAGNEYQEGSIEFDIKVLATQLNSEEDSFGPDYDKDALYAVADDLYIDETTGGYVALSTAGLASAAAVASKDDSITSVNYVNEAGQTVEVPVAKTSAALDTAISANDIVVVTSGNYTVDTAKNTAVTIIGNGENTTFGVESEGEHNTDYGFDGSNVTFENLTFNVNGYLNGYARMKATYNNCTINGTYTLNDNSVFNNCTFNKTGDDYCIWTWGAGTAEFNDCVFNCDGKAILLYGGANTALTLNNCEFIDNGAISGKAAIEVGSDWTTDSKSIVMTNCTVNGFDTTEQKSNTYGGTNLGTNVWGNKNLLPEDRLSVTIDGVKVYGN
jgi:predicted ribosomally synthesized peptide with SipW-like signal peptide